VAALNDVFFDSSFFVAGLVRSAGGTGAERRVIEAIEAGTILRPMTAWHCCLEVQSVLTRLPPEYRLTPREAFALVDALILEQFRIVQLPTDKAREFLAGSVEEGIGGGRLYDAEIAAVARHAGATAFVTSNRRHFTGLLADGIRVLTPEELLLLLPA
jgi:predicted nucleic acid-binding protein